MPSLGPDDVQDLEELEREIATLTNQNPELRTAYQRVRSAFTVAEALSNVLTTAGLTVEKAASIAEVPREAVEGVLRAASGKPATIETVSAISDAAGFDFELQFLPERKADWAIDEDRPATGDVVQGGILVQWMPQRERHAIRTALLFALCELSTKAHSPPNVPEMISVLRDDHEVELWELVRVAEDCGFRLQFRFVRQDQTGGTVAARQLVEGRVTYSGYRGDESTDELDASLLAHSGSIYATVES